MATEFHASPPGLDKKYLVWIHGELSLLHELLAARAIPHSYQAEGCEPVAEVLEFLEELTNNTPI